jgi:gliding motility-associated-like protein
MRLFALFIFVLILAAPVVAQSPYSSTQGTFTLDQIRGCAPFTITIDAPGCTGSQGCEVFYEGNSSIGLDQTNPSTYSHTYTVPGKYNVRLLQGVNFDNLEIEVFENIAPKFEALNCGGSKVTVNILDKNYFQYVINYGDGSADDVVSFGTKPQHVYASTGNQTITVRGIKQNAADNCNSAVENVIVLSQLIAPTITSLEVINSTSTALEMVTSPNVSYKFEVAVNNNSSFQQIKALYNETADTVVNLKTDDNFYCFQLGAYNPCAGKTKYSTVICSANVDLEVLNNENKVTWTTSSAGSSEQVISRTSPSDGITITSPVTSSPYLDDNITCGTEYCYQLLMNYPDGRQSISIAKCGVAISTDIPDPVADISAIVNDKGLELEWLQPAGFTPKDFLIFKSIAGDYGFLDSVAVYQYADPEYTIGSNSCYRISFVDVCGNASPQSEEACPIQLTGSVEDNNNIDLSWTPYGGYANGVDHYTIEKYTAGGTLLQSTDVNTTSFTDESKDLDLQLYVFVVKAVPKISGFSPSVSNSIEVIKDPNLFYPKSFTPNGDGLNDLFNVYGQYITTFQMDIFNRWGELMFTTNQLEVGWDGNYKGTAMPEGTYTFVAVITDLAGRTFKKSGSVLLLRKR